MILTGSCEKALAGSEFVVAVGDSKLPAKTIDTGAWGRFTQWKLGQITIDKAGKHTLTVQPRAKPRWRSMGLRSIVLRKR